MKKELQDNKKFIKFNRRLAKVHGIKRFFNSIIYSLEGIIYGYKYEQSMWIHGFAVLIAVILGMILKIELYEWAIIFVALGIILALELINTAIEATVDLITDEFHPLAKIAKDCGSAASFVMAIVSVVISLFVYVPHFMNMFS